MKMVQVKNNEITLRSVPENYTHEDESVTLGYNLLPTEELSKDGWVEVVEVKPTYNPDTQYLTLESEVVGVNKVTATYKVVDIVIPPIVPSDVDELQSALASTELKLLLLERKIERMVV